MNIISPSPDSVPPSAGKSERDSSAPPEKKKREISPARIVIFSFVGVIVIGTLLLCLPASGTRKPLKVEDALFTATSAVCVTGLTVVDTENDISFWGQTVVLALIQLGGLGIMTYSTFFFLLFRRKYISQNNVVVLSETLSAGTSDVRRLLFAVFKVTMMFELWGILLLYLFWRKTLPADKIWWDCAFHSISAFCNAGLSTFSANVFHVRQIKSGCAVIMGLIICGGLGFTVIESLLYRRYYIKSGRKVLPLQTKVVLTTTALLIISGTLLFWILDAHHSLDNDPFFNKGFHALFQSVTSRTAGFNTVNLGKASALGVILLTILMFIGGSPGSTAGGIKTTTAAIIFATIRSLMKNPQKGDVEIFKRRIPADIVNRAFVIAVLSFALVSSVTILLTITEGIKMSAWPKGQEPILRLLFETVSAFGTVGLSTGITPHLSVMGKLLITMTMLIGRVGPLTVVIAMSESKHVSNYHYPEEKVMVG